MDARRPLLQPALDTRQLLVRILLLDLRHLHGRLRPVVVEPRTTTARVIQNRQIVLIIRLRQFIVQLAQFRRQLYRI